MDFKKFHQELLAMKDPNYQTIQSNILPNITKESIIGIRYAKLIRFAKKNFDDKFKQEFLNNLPHKFFEENLIHIWLISKMKDYDECIKAIKAFLPYMDNWEVCDSLIPKVFLQKPNKAIKEIKVWLADDSTYTARFAIFMLLKFYLDENYNKKYLQWVADIKSDDYYIEMMAAWFFVEGLVKHYDDTIILMQKRLIYPKIHTKIIQKALESVRLSDETKEYLKTLRRGNW